MEYGCIGEHLKHSFSAEIHRELASYRYELQELAPEEVGAFLTAGDFRGINVTIPYKETVIPYLSYIDEQAKAIGAVNTIVNRNGRLYGYNTDFYGMNALIARLGLSLAGKKVAVLGTGGTSRTACAVAESLGSSTVLRVSRSARNGAIDYETLSREHADVQVLINTTPCGMYPHPHATADPSQADFQVTEICQRICYTAGVMLADHLIYSPDGIYSFYQSGALCKIAEQIVE